MSEQIGGLVYDTPRHWRICTQDTPSRTVCSRDQSFEVGAVDCAETITRNTWVGHDVAAHCKIFIGADNITLNLNEHIVGTIENPGFDNVTIENGATKGIFLTDAADNVVRDVVLGTPGNTDGHGINAVAGVRDHGGNTAIGNGNPVQCVNVFCSRP